MAESLRVILQGCDSDVTTYDSLIEAAKGASFDDALIVSAFVSTRGVRLLNQICELSGITRSRWVVGLDGVITSPDSLEEIARAPALVSFRGWKQESAYPTLHAKLFCFLSNRPARVVTYIGSGNATEGGMLTNIEAGLISILEGTAAAKQSNQYKELIEGVLKSD